MHLVYCILLFVFFSFTLIHAVYEEAARSLDVVFIWMEFGLLLNCVPRHTHKENSTKTVSQLKALRATNPAIPMMSSLDLRKKRRMMRSAWRQNCRRRSPPAVTPSVSSGWRVGQMQTKSLWRPTRRCRRSSSPSCWKKISAPGKKAPPPVRSSWIGEWGWLAPGLECLEFIWDGESEHCIDGTGPNNYSLSIYVLFDSQWKVLELKGWRKRRLGRETSKKGQARAGLMRTSNLTAGTWGWGSGGGGGGGGG